MQSAILRPEPINGANPELAFVDHAHTMRRLRSIWRSAQAGEGYLVSLVGENGSGRSRLIRELSTTIDAEDDSTCWLLAQAYSYATYQPLSLLADLFVPWCGEDRSISVTGRLATALAVLADSGSLQDRWTCLSLARDIRDARSREELLGLPLAEVFADALARVLSDRPVVIVLEDLEWIDAASLAVLDGLVARLSTSKALILNTHHADWSHDWPNIARHAQLYLGTLSRTESLQLIDQVANQRDLNDAVRDALAVEINGNPLLLKHATLAVIEANVTDPAAVPKTLLAALRMRIEALSPAVRQVLFVAAVLGQRFAYRAIARVTEALLEQRDTLDLALQELSTRRFVVRWSGGPEVTYRFTHALVQEVAFSLIAASERKALEARVAEWTLLEGANPANGVTRVLDELDQLVAQAPFYLPEQPSDQQDNLHATPTNIFPLPRDEKARAEVLARIVLADLLPEQRATLVLCLEHGYTYAEAGELLGVSRETVRDQIYKARKLFKRIQEASEEAVGARSMEGAS